MNASSGCRSDSGDRAADLRVEVVSAGWCELQERPSACEEARELLKLQTAYVVCVTLARWSKQNTDNSFILSVYVGAGVSVRAGSPHNGSDPAAAGRNRPRVRASLPPALVYLATAETGAQRAGQLRRILPGPVDAAGAGGEPGVCQQALPAGGRLRGVRGAGSAREHLQ